MYHSVKPASLQQQLEAVHLDPDKAEAFSQAWATAGPELVEKLKHSTFAPKKVRLICMFFASNSELYKHLIQHHLNLTLFLNAIVRFILSQTLFDWKYSLLIRMVSSLFSGTSESLDTKLCINVVTIHINADLLLLEFIPAVCIIKSYHTAHRSCHIHWKEGVPLYYALTLQT